MGLIDCILLTHNESRATLRCLDSLRPYAGGLRLVWVDNGSEADECALVEAYVRRNFDLRHVETLQHNLGYTAGVNVGLRWAMEHRPAPRLLLLNNDTVLGPGCIESLCQLPERVGIAGPLTNADAQAQGLRMLRGVLREEADRVNLRNAADVAEHLRAATHRIHPRDRFLPTREVAFFCAMLRRDVVSKVGLLDESMRTFGSDDDYCRRAASAGFRVGVKLDAYCQHDHRRMVHRVFGIEGALAEQRRDTDTLNAKGACA